MSPQSLPQPASSDVQSAYQSIVLRRVHQLLKLGYGRLDSSAYRSAQEEVISGDLADAIDGLLDETSSPSWMDFFSVHSEAPVTAPRRKGKRRRRVDIRIDSALRRPRTRFPFESKRLCEGHSVATYLGEYGLGRFLQGDYARSEDTAGMLGFVQSREPAEWAQDIGRTLVESPGHYLVVEQRNWRHASVVDGLEHTYCSTHRRHSINRPIDIYHTLLDFS